MIANGLDPLQGAADRVMSAVQLCVAQASSVNRKRIDSSATLSQARCPEYVYCAHAFGVKKKLTVNRANRWVAWARRAFESFPNGEGTLDDVCAFLQADPNIAPLLDTRPYMNLRAIPTWRRSVSFGLKALRGLVNTGEARDGLALYRYNPQDAIVDTCGAGALKRRRQPAGLPFLGKRSKN
ncbi:hypothetical protein PLESTM_000731200 [Pleodorina starrii]|nr:hypothetical protein PLESTM_000731200 [Pleodorina starrii]